jgi:hypothetical protein
MICSLTGVALVSIGRTLIEQAPCQHCRRDQGKNLFHHGTIIVIRPDSPPRGAGGRPSHHLFDTPRDAKSAFGLRPYDVDQPFVA